MLLHWCTLEPAGAGNLAAIRFSSPVRVQSIKLFPTGAQPFAQHPEIVSRTEPKAFYLQLFFNTYRSATLNSKEKPKPSNALVSTTCAYAGGQMEFAVPMSLENPTTIMIVRGSFESVSMAIYGDIMSEIPPLPTTYEPRTLPSIEPISLAPALDPSNSLNPPGLALQLLSLIPDAPPLPLAVSLVFCLKPPSDDWDDPDFPYLHPDLAAETEEIDLEKAFRLTTRPVADDIEDDTLRQFAESVARCVRVKENNQSYFIAGILAHAASQHPNMVKFLLENLDLTTIFDASMDDSTLIKLQHAATNADIARHLNNEAFLELLSSIFKDPNVATDTRTAASQLISRITNWAVLEDAISNTQGDFVMAARILKELCADEQSLGIWLQCMTTHDDLVNALHEIPTMPLPLSHPPYLFGCLKSSSVSHDEFVAFLRAVLGVAAVLAVYAFADAYPHQLCRERALGIIRLWQGVDGYREIVNHLLLLKQMTFRLECMMDNDPPRRAGLDAEHIVVNLAREPHAILQPDLIKCILSLRPPLSYITEDERYSMRQAAIIADDGLAGALDELLPPFDCLLDFTNLRNLRVALAVIEQELREDRECQVLEEFWEEGAIGLLTCLVETFVPVANELKGQFGVRVPSRKSQELMTQLFRAADELLQLLLRLCPAYPLPSREVTALTTSVADLFVCTDAADMLFSQTSHACIAAQETRQTCIEAVRTLSLGMPSEGSKPGAEVVLRALLLHAVHYGDRDPVYHVLQIFCLVDHLLPMPDADEAQQTLWTQRVLPLLLQELWAFCRVLDAENKAHFVKRLFSLDRGVVGIGEWLLLEELRETLHALQSLDDPSIILNERVVRQHQVFLSVQFMLDLVGGSSTAAKACVGCLSRVPEAASALTACLNLLLDQRVTSASLAELVHVLAANSATLDEQFRTTLVLALLRSGAASEPHSTALADVLDLCLVTLPSPHPSDGSAEKFGHELGALFTHIQAAPDPPDATIAEKCVALLEKLLQEGSFSPALTLHSLTPIAFATFLDRIQHAMPPEWIARLDAIKNKLSISEDVSPTLPPIPLPETVELSIHEVDELLRARIPPPSTPPRRVLNQDVLGLVTISPPALIRSPALTGLTKTYSHNEFRLLRQVPSARQNTSRLPSMHVDEFETASSSPTIVTVPMPLTAGAMPFATEGF